MTPGNALPHRATHPTPATPPPAATRAALEPFACSMNPLLARIDPLEPAGPGNEAARPA
jgi:hypothetical protein